MLTKNQSAYLLFNKNKIFFYLIVLSLLVFNGLTVNAQNKKDSVLEKVEIEASFPGGEAAWTKYVFNAMKDADIRWKNSDAGTCIIRFIVDKHGNINDIVAMNMKKTRLAKFAIEVISNGPKWKPAIQNGKPVNAFREQPITLTLVDEPKKKRE